MIDVYISELPDKVLGEPLVTKERQSEIDAISNERVRREKYYVWRLLEYALKNSLGVSIADAELKKGDTGKWTSSVCELSLSHSGKALAVALSDNAVGVDVERIRIRSLGKMAEHILTEREREEYSNIPSERKQEHLICKWCQKEAIFKLQNLKSFNPSKTETGDFFCQTDSVEMCGEKYILSVAAKKEEKIRFFKK